MIVSRPGPTATNRRRWTPAPFRRGRSSGMDNASASAMHAQRGTDMNRILYSGTRNASSWAFRAWLALKEAGVDFEERIVDIRKPQRFENLARIQAFSPPGA